MSYSETLPEGCPPDASVEIDSEMRVFRLVKRFPAKLEDFRSQRAEKPEGVFKGVNECQAWGVSVFTDRVDAEQKALRLPRFRGFQVCPVRLTAGAGRIQSTFQPSHHTWWPFAKFDILAHCETEAA
ncbi:MAG: hypothetical protein NTZ94_01665 [Verrucomicrobia bacterium]|nr:hypothetical protein [Verrucomicrobiota bacterium]